MHPRPPSSQAASCRPRRGSQSDAGCGTPALRRRGSHACFGGGRSSSPTFPIPKFRARGDCPEVRPLRTDVTSAIPFACDTTSPLHRGDSKCTGSELQRQFQRRKVHVALAGRIRRGALEFAHEQVGEPGIQPNVSWNQIPTDPELQLLPQFRPGRTAGIPDSSRRPRHPVLRRATGNDGRR